MTLRRADVLARLSLDILVALSTCPLSTLAFSSAVRLAVARYLYYSTRSEVLEATGNPTEVALAGGGFYSPEGFPFQNM